MLAGIRRSSLSLFAAVALLTACGASRQPEAVSQEPPAPQYPAGVVAPNGRSYPQVPNAAEPLGLQLNRVEAELATVQPSDPRFAELAHRQQVLYRRWSHHQEWDALVLQQLNPELRPVAKRQVQARREFLAMHRNSPAPAQLPAWRISPPISSDELLQHYKQAEQDTGIDWATLAAINLVETGMGRLQGLSVAGARGPMQFLPSTWAEPGIGAGSIDDPSDAIAAAARYLVRRGGPENMPQAIWGYNNSWNYVRAVQTYADLMREDPNRLAQFHQ